MAVTVSIVIPMYNEREGAAANIATVIGVMEQTGWSFEIVPVNDGSIDGTGEVLAELAAKDDRVRPASYTPNRGRGRALRTGFAASRGRYIASLDADLSYAPEFAVKMVRTLMDDDGIDVVIGSQYMPGGSTRDVPFIRLALSRIGNVILRRSLTKKVWTSTGVCRAYKADSLKALDLEADDKVIHLEILSKSFSLGYRVVEVPVVLAARTAGRSKFRPKATIESHLLFSLLERPARLYAVFALLLLIGSVAIGGYLLDAFLRGELNPERPLMTVMLILFLGGQAGLGFAIMATILLDLRRAVLRLHRDVRVLERRLTEGEDRAS